MKREMMLKDQDLDMVVGGRGGRRVGLGTIIKFILELFGNPPKDNNNSNGN